MGNIVDLNEENFENEVLKSEKPVVVDFWATWCGPCRKLTPVIEDIAGEYDRVKFGKVNVEDNKELAKNYSITGIPCLLIFKNGEAVERMTGLMPKSTILSNIEKHV